MLRPLIEAIDGMALKRPASGEAQVVEASVARLRAHGIHSVIVLHGQWLPRTVLNELVSAATLAGLDLFVVTHPDNDTAEVAPDWRSAIWDLSDLRTWIAEQTPAWRQAAIDPRRHQRDPMPELGLPDLTVGVTVSRPETEAANDAFAFVRQRLPVAPPLHLVAIIVRQLLGSVDVAERTAAVAGAAAALNEAGFAMLRSTSGAAPIEWRALRRIPDTTQAAAVTLMAIGLDDRDCARLDTDSVDLAADQIQIGKRAVAIPPAARPFLAAQRFVRDGGRGAFLTVDGQRAGPPAIRRLMVDGLRCVGRALDERDFDRGLSVSQRWLMARGLLVRRTREADRIRLPDERQEVGQRRCRHGLTAWIETEDGQQVSHSQRLCRATAADEARPSAAGYVVSIIEESDRATGYEVRAALDDRGALWTVLTPFGHVWVQSLARERPATAAVELAVLRAQMVRPSRGQPSR